jgi:ribosome-associated protein
LESPVLAHKLAWLLWEKKGDQILIMDLRKLTPIADYFLVCSVDTDIQARAIVHHIEEQMRPEGIRPWHVEGAHETNWVLLDFVTVVVHLFKPEARAFYHLEGLWGDAEMTEINDSIYKDSGHGK